MTITTSFTAVVLAAWTAVGINPSMPWQSDYGTAVRIAAEVKKPLAVFLGHGNAGPSALIRDGGLGAEETKTLADGYVSVYIDVDTAAGKKLATSFEITEGVVISNRTGSLQAVLHEGTVTKTELTDYLTRYAEPTRDVTTTEYGGRRRPIVHYLTDPNRNRPVINTLQNVTSYFSGST